MENLNKLRHLYKLKTVYRKTKVDTRDESFAEHIYSMMILAQYLLASTSLKLDYMRLMKIILYHDINEITDSKAFLDSEYLDFANEYIEQKSLESRYVSGIDALDPIIHSLDIKENWINFGEESIRKHREHRVKEFPEQLVLLEDAIKYLKEKGFID